ncbi:EF-hand domain-containing protein, partial [Vannielia sp.]|uniref:EF-hand domain-containing protein n=1 Tax=Vannielia sp. TaxID=2813045 RepID=UPI00260B1FB3
RGQRGATAEQRAEMRTEMMQRMFDRIDTNDDGQVSEQEFETAKAFMADRQDRQGERGGKRNN